jgi:hypothetical protein
VTPEDEARVKVLEDKIETLKATFERLLSIVEAPPLDPVAAAFQKFQQRADKQMGRG